MSYVLNIADLRRLAQRRLPRVVFDYIDGGAEDEVTLRANEHAFDEVTLRPRGAIAIAECDLRTTVLGTQHALPFILAGALKIPYDLVLWRTFRGIRPPEEQR